MMYTKELKRFSPMPKHLTKRIRYFVVGTFMLSTAFFAPIASAQLLGGIAAGANSIALGTGTVAIGAQSTAIGTGAGTTGANAVAVGQAVANGINAIAIGAGAITNGVSSIAIGDQARSGGNNSVALGLSTVSGGANSTAVGVNARSAGVSSSAIGSGAVANGMNGVAFGVSAISTGTNSVALGSAADDAGRANVVSVGSAGNERQISNVASGLQMTDAVNFGQLSTVAASSAQANSRITALESQLASNVRMLSGGIAAVAALAPVGSAEPGRFHVGGSVASYNGQTGVGFTLQRRSLNGQTTLHGGLAWASGGSKAVARVGLGHSF